MHSAITSAIIWGKVTDLRSSGLGRCKTDGVGNIGEYDRDLGDGALNERNSLETIGEFEEASTVRSRSKVMDRVCMGVKYVCIVHTLFSAAVKVPDSSLYRLRKPSSVVLGILVRRSVLAFQIVGMMGCG
jgi:hypothetical protein